MKLLRSEFKIDVVLTLENCKDIKLIEIQKDTIRYYLIERNAKA